MSIPPVSAIADVLALAGLDGWLTPPLLPIVAPPRPLMGSAVTIELRAESPGSGLSPLHDLVSHDLRDHVVVIAGARAIGGAVWGEIMSRAASQQGAIAVLLDGIARDAAAMAGEGLPVYAAELAVVGPAGRASIHRVGTAVDVGGVSVTPGDAVVVDASGAVRLATSTRDGVLDAARAYAAAEEQVLAALAAGEPLVEAYRFKKAVVNQLTATLTDWGRSR
ncbi:MAG: RraA family protein [Acidimicrobiales bacterium]